MWSRSGGEGFAKDVGKFMVVHQNTSHVDQSIIRGEFVGKEELVDLSIIHLGEVGEGCYIDKGNFQRNEWSWRQSGWRGQRFR